MKILICDRYIIEHNDKDSLFSLITRFMGSPISFVYIEYIPLDWHSSFIPDTKEPCNGSFFLKKFITPTVYGPAYDEVLSIINNYTELQHIFNTFIEQCYKLNIKKRTSYECSRPIRSSPLDSCGNILPVYNSNDTILFKNEAFSAKRLWQTFTVPYSESLIAYQSNNQKKIRQDIEILLNNDDLMDYYLNGYQLKIYRLRCALTQTDLLQDWGFSLVSIKSWESGKRKPPLYARKLLVEKYSKLLKIRIQKL